jgi:hypothetical protein
MTRVKIQNKKMKKEGLNIPNFERSFDSDFEMRIPDLPSYDFLKPRQ